MIWKGQGVVASFVQATFAVAALSRSEGGQGWSGEQAWHRLRSVVHKGQARRVPLSRLQVMTKKDCPVFVVKEARMMIARRSGRIMTQTVSQEPVNSSTRTFLRSFITSLRTSQASAFLESDQKPPFEAEQTLP